MSPTNDIHIASTPSLTGEICVEGGVDSQMPSGHSPQPAIDRQVIPSSPGEPSFANGPPKVGTVRVAKDPKARRTESMSGSPPKDLSEETPPLPRLGGDSYTAAGGLSGL